MGKRSDFERNPRDYYPTPYDACVPLLKYLPKNTEFVEPCAGDGRLIKHFERHGHKCTEAYDIKPMAPGIVERDVLFMGGVKFRPKQRIITNPPWEREVLHAMITNFSDQLPTWLLFDSDWAYTTQAAPFEKICQTIIAVGRVKWIEGSSSSGMDNCSWYEFRTDRGDLTGKTNFIFRD